MSRPAQTCPFCFRVMEVHCPCGCGLTTPYDVCEACQPEGFRKRLVFVPTRVCEAYVRKQLGL